MGLNIVSVLGGIGITWLAFALGVRFREKLANPLFNPTFFAMVAIIIFLQIFEIDYDSYNAGGRLVGSLLGPATIALAVPIYKQRQLLTENFFIVMLSITIGAFVGIVSGVLLAAFLGGEIGILLSIAPKSVTTPIAIELSRSIGGIPSLTVAMVTIAGVFGSALGPEIINKVGVRNAIARGLGIGTASHGLGTSRAVQVGETEGAFSGLAMGIAGIITAILTPLLVALLSR